MRVQAVAAQNQGRRKEQQDHFAIFDGNVSKGTCFDGVLAVIADGMGGMAMGGECAQQTVSSFITSFKESDYSAGKLTDSLKNAAYFANSTVYELAEQAGYAEEAGSTLVAALIWKQTLHWVSVGDSRIYVCRRGQMLQINDEHNVRERINKLVKKGLLNLTEVDHDQNMEALTSYIGIRKLTEIDISLHPFLLQEGDIVLLCSDGLYKTLPEAEISSVLSERCNNNLAELLVKKTIEADNPSQDNVTVAVVKCVGEPETILIPKKNNSRQDKDNKDTKGFFNSFFIKKINCKGGNN